MLKIIRISGDLQDNFGNYSQVFKPLMLTQASDFHGEVRTLKTFHTANLNNADLDQVKEVLVYDRTPRFGCFLVFLITKINPITACSSSTQTHRRSNSSTT